ncbi:YjbE family putative metal transport protein [Ktedonospora formicarum]|uniref:Membrane protein n=1 Tax=Ktedonospora formicarum TaxID=2778364 RepID=A0A8J3MUB9_9CHLR|nr:YjbE family putative metal transport protein [Ktedonospora formicarum]GHO46468.1 membrane protein [Ktedonospora formicarum]
MNMLKGIEEVGALLAGFSLIGLLKIVLSDLALSGDNALVIGASAAGLDKKQRWWAILLGGGGAIVLRILFTVIASFLLGLPLLQAIGGAVLLYIAIKLLMEKGDKTKLPEEQQEELVKEQKKAGKKRNTFANALLTILIADATMSLDNVLAVAGIAEGHIPTLVIGLLISIALLLLGSALISALMSRFPLLLDLASLVLAWTAGGMLVEDRQLGPILTHVPYADFAFPIAAIIVVLIADIFLWRRNANARLAEQTTK